MRKPIVSSLLHARDDFFDMALSEVAMKTYTIVNFTRTVICASVILCFAAQSLTCFLPKFHNHGPLATNTCCCDSKKSCDIPHTHAHHNTAAEFCSARQLEHAHGPCFACMWQAMAKRITISYFVDQIPTLLPSQEYEISSTPQYCSSLRLQEPRAPPF